MPISLISPSSTHFLFTLCFSLHHNPYHRRRGLFSPPLSAAHLRYPPIFASYPSRTLVGHSADEASPSDAKENWEFTGTSEDEAFDFDEGFASTELKHLVAPELEVKELDEFPEKWRRSRLAWLCEQLPAHRAAAIAKILKAHRDWLRQEDSTYIVVHCLRIRENDSGFRVYKWMMQQSWYRFDLALANKLADYLGKERKFSKCREIFDDIINQGCIPSESTFHILIIAYLSFPNIESCLEEACNIYNQMIHLGGYKPQLSLHNSLFRALVSKPGSSSKQYLKQAEFVFHNVRTSRFKIQKDIYTGLIWLHSYQDNVDKERIASLRQAMQQRGFEEGGDVILSILRACAKNGNVEEAERTWLKLLCINGAIPSQAFVYKMEVYAKAGKPMKSLEIFRKMQESGSTTYVAYNKIIEVLCKAQEMQHAETIMEEFIKSGKKSLLQSFIDLMNMYFNMSLYDKLELTFIRSLDKCQPDCTVYNIYLDSLVRLGDIDKAYRVFNEMRHNGEIGVNAQSCNSMLSGFLSSGNSFKVLKMYKLMRLEKYKVDTPLMEKLDLILKSNKKQSERPERPKLSKEQREILVGLLLGGLRIEPDRRGKSHVIQFEFNFASHSALKARVYEQFQDWIHHSWKQIDDSDAIPCTFDTISDKYFSFYADQFWPKGRPMIPKLIHHWLSPCALAYWYMYGGQRAPSGDIVLRLKGDCEGAKRVVKALRANSLEFRVKRRGSFYWIGFLGSNSSLFWELIEPYVLSHMEDVSEEVEPGHASGYGLDEDQEVSLHNGSDFDDNSSNYRDIDDF